MPAPATHDLPLISTIAAAFTAAWILGIATQKLRLSPIVGYLLAGVAIGPHTPGFIGNLGVAQQLSEVGVILLMFGVGLHFSVRDLLSVKSVAVPGALLQMAFTTLLGLGLASLMGWPLPAGLFFGLALSVASTVVTMRALQERRLMETDRGRVAVGWLVVQDFAMVLALVLVPALAGLAGHRAAGDQATGAVTADFRDVLLALGLTLVKIAAFVVSMLVVGRRVIPWLLHYIVHTGSRELFRLGVLVIALGVAYGSAALFGVSFALGAFFAGMILSESALSQQAAAESIPLRDAFAVLFFVSVGMLFNPTILFDHPWPVLAAFLIVTVGNPVAAFFLTRTFRQPVSAVLPATSC